MITIEEAYSLIEKTVQPLETTLLPMEQSVGRRIAQLISSDVDSPPHNKSMMDGVAVRSEDIEAGQREFSIVETIVAGTVPAKEVGSGQAARIMTGAPMPEGADCVIMIEQTKTQSDDESRVIVDVDSIQTGKHTMTRSSNFASGDPIFAAGHRIRPTDIGLLAEIGASQISVGGLPSVAVLPTGDELVDCNQKPSAGQIRNSNGPMLLAICRQLGLETSDFGIGRDERKDLESKIRLGLEKDLLILSGGVSAGKLDLVPGILNDAGVNPVFHKVMVKPGKPIWFGYHESEGRRGYVFGLPGNPVSSLVGFRLFVSAAIRLMEGASDVRPQSVQAVLSRQHETRGNRPTYWPARRVEDNSTTRSVEPLIWRGSSDLLALSMAEGLIYFSADSHDHPAGEVVPFIPFL